MTARRLVTVLAMSALLALPPAACAEPAVSALPRPDRETLHIPRGGQDFIALPAAVTRVALSDPAIADVKLVTARQVRLLALKEGAADLMLWTRGAKDGRAFTIMVGPAAAALKAALAARPGLDMVTAASDGASLQGSVANLQQSRDAQDIADAASRDAQKTGDVQNNVTVDGRRMVAVEVRFAAVSTATMKALGFNLNKLGGGFQFAAAPPNTLNGFQFTPPADLGVSGSLPLAQAFNLLLAWPHADFLGVVSALGSANLAQVLAEPTLLVRNGEDANFLAGGEIPVPVPQSGQAAGAIAIQYRKFGVQLNVHATILSDDRIVIRLNPEVSELDFQNALTLQGFNIPAIRSRSTQTTIELGDGQSFVLAGLLYSSRTSVEEKVPGIGDLPIIGDFFKRSQHSGEQQQLIIVATPHLVSPLPPGAVTALPGQEEAYAPSTAQMLLNNRQLDDHIARHGLIGP